MAWEANIVVTNNTLHNILLTHDTLGEVGVVSSNQTFNWNTVTQDNKMIFKFWDEPNVFFMETRFNFREGTPSYINRGILPEGKQDIKMTVYSNADILYEQYNGIGGMNFLLDVFNENATVYFVYDPISNPLPLTSNTEEI